MGEGEGEGEGEGRSWVEYTHIDIKKRHGNGVELT